MTNDQYKSLKGTVQAAASKYAKRIIGHAEKEDIEQVAWVAAISATKEYDTLLVKDAKLSTFAYPKIHSACKDFLKKFKNTRREVSLDAPLNEGEDEYSDAPQSLYDVIGTPANQDQALDIARLEASLLDLVSPKHVSLVVMLAQGLTLQEIAQNTNMNVNTVKSAIYRAHQKLAGKAA